jgi:hypothetical protein
VLATHADSCRRNNRALRKLACPENRQFARARIINIDLTTSGAPITRDCSLQKQSCAWPMYRHLLQRYEVWARRPCLPRILRRGTRSHVGESAGRAKGYIRSLGARDSETRLCLIPADWSWAHFGRSVRSVCTRPRARRTTDGGAQSVARLSGQSRALLSLGHRARLRHGLCLPNTRGDGVGLRDHCQLAAAGTHRSTVGVDRLLSGDCRYDVAMVPVALVSLTRTTGLAVQGCFRSGACQSRSCW